MKEALTEKKRGKEGLVKERMSARMKERQEKNKGKRKKERKSDSMID